MDATVLLKNNDLATGPPSSTVRNLVYELSLSENPDDNSKIENEVKNCLSLLKISPKNFIDIGANKGEYTNYLLRLKPNLECHIFEPSLENFEKLKNRFSPYCSVATWYLWRSIDDEPIQY